MTRGEVKRSAALAEQIAGVEARIPDATRGLPEEVFLFVSRVTPLVNVDLLIRDERGRVLLTWRADEFHGPGWHVPGGIVRYHETMAERIRAVALTELGATVNFVAEPLAIHEILHDPGTSRSHFISFLFACTLGDSPSEQLRYRQGEIRPGEWAWHETCPVDIIQVHEIYRQHMTSR